MKEEVFEILETILDYHKEDIEETYESSLTMQKNALYANLLAFLSVSLNSKIEQQMLRLLKNTFTLRGPNDEKADCFELKRLQLRNSYLNFFRSALSNSSQFTQSIFQQYLKIVSPILQVTISDLNPETRIEELKGILMILEALALSSTNLQFQSILLFGEYI